MFKYSTAPASWYLTVHLFVFLVTVPPFLRPSLLHCLPYFQAVICYCLLSANTVCSCCGFFCLFVCLFFWAVWSHLISVEKNLFLIHGFLSHSLTSSLSLSFIFLYRIKKRKRQQHRSGFDLDWTCFQLIDRTPSCSGGESWYQLVFLSSSSIKLQVVLKMQTRGCDSQNT